MSPVDRERLAAIELVSYRGSAYRHVSPSYDPRSGEGARIHGGRFNPPESFPVLYLCTSRACTVAEFLRLSTRQPVGPEGLLPRTLVRFDLDLDLVLDLTEEATLSALGIVASDLVSDERTTTRQIGVTAHGLSFQAIRSRSATGADDVLAIFPDHLGTSNLDVAQLEVWDSLDDLGE